MPKQTRTQKKRNVNDAIHQLKQLSEYYTGVVNSYFLFKEWIEAIMPKYEDTRLDGAVKMCIVQTMVYFNTFMQEVNGKTCIVVSKDEVVKHIKENQIYDQIRYEDTYTKETVMNILDKCIENFFTNTIFPVIDKSEIKEEK